MTRTNLFGYFRRNNTPTEDNFAEMIRAMLNQIDDGIRKLGGNPLQIKAEGGEESERAFLDIHKDFNQGSPAQWRLSLNPPIDLSNPSGARAEGLSIGNGPNTSQLFIDRASSNVGIGTTTPDPDAKLTVNGNLKIAGNSLIMQDEWLEADLNRAWTSFETGLSPKYFKDKQGFVHLKGSVKIPALSATDQVIFNLKRGYRPSVRGRFVTVSDAGRFVPAFIEILESDGGVRFISGGTTWVSLDGISYQAK